MIPALPPLTPMMENLASWQFWVVSDCNSLRWLLYTTYLHYILHIVPRKLYDANFVVTGISGDKIDIMATLVVK